MDTYRNPIQIALHFHGLGLVEGLVSELNSRLA
jgi:hypothetical protein